MTLNDLLTTKALWRLAVLTVMATVAVLFAVTPAALDLDTAGTERWYVVGWIVAAFCAGLAALRAAAKSDGAVRNSWLSFGLGSFLWMAGTLTWASYGLVGAVLPFPSLADALYIFTAVAFMSGMFHYSLPGSGGSRIQVTNFAMAIFAVVAIGFILYFPVLADSDMGWFGAILAFSYPALALSSFAFGLICYCLYVPRHGRFSFLLILAAASAHAAASFFYGIDILNHSYAAGTFYDVYWIVGYGLVAWAALEHSPAWGMPPRPAGRTMAAVRPGEALIPALSLAAILVAGLAARWPELRPEAVLVVPVMFGFSALLAIREHALLSTERSLRAEAEESTRRLAASEKQLSGVLETTTDGVMVLDPEWRITFANQNAVNMLFPDQPHLGIPLWQVLKSSPDSVFYKNYAIAMEQQILMKFEAHFPPMDIWFEVHVFPTPDSLTIFFRDVTERRRLTEELVRLSRHDPLTGLANRMLFGERLASGLQGGRRHRDITLVLIDLDDFKDVNDTLGHMAGDCLLQQFASRLAKLVRHGDTAARLGGDEFAVIQPGPAGPEGGAELARRISDAMLTPFDIQGTEVTLSVSIGIAIAPQHGSQPDELNGNADKALYRAKHKKDRGSNTCIFEPGVDGRSRQPLRLKLQRA